MHVTAGSRLGPYEVLSRIGAGGMGEVWSARDTRLDRRVAVKILPPDLAHDAQFRLRFEREARTISQLSHPHICTLFDVGEDYLVMELLEGETLADRIARGPLPINDVLRYGTEIAEALGAAHGMGIVHRDLKPGNVMLTKSGAKLLDFGLAKSASAVVAADGATEHRPLTQEGTILGTFQYMAPEQLEGADADARTDIFALGVVLYEMATGRRAFQGKTRTSLIAQIVSADPKPLRDLQPLTPRAFEHVVARCLSKDPDERWQSAVDVAEELRWTMSAPEIATRTKSSRLPWTIAAVATLAAIAAIALFLLRSPKVEVMWADIMPPKGIEIVGPGDRGGSAVAPDGKRFVFVGREAQGAPRLFVRELASAESRVIAMTEGASFPFWAPDSRAVAFFAEGKLKRVDVNGGRPAVVVDETDGRGGSWAADGTIVFAASSTSGLSRVRGSGGKPETITVLTGDQNSHRFPWFLPDGKHFLYYAQGGRDEGIYVASADGRVNRRLNDAKHAPVFSGNSLLYLKDGSLFAHELDVDKLELRGDAKEIASGITGSSTGFGNIGLSASGEGSILLPSEFSERTRFVWRNRNGEVLQAFGGDRTFAEPAFAPDEKRVVAFNNEGAADLWETDLERGRMKRLTFEQATASAPAWSHDGKQIVFSTARGGKAMIASIPAAGGSLRVLATTPQPFYTETFTPDDQFVMLDGPAAGRKDFDVSIMTVAGGQIRPFLSTPANEVRVQFSLDGKFFSYTSDESGRSEVYVQTYPITGAKWQVSTGGGDQSFWRGDGKELFYLSPEGKIVSVPVTDGPSFGDPLPLFQAPFTPVSITGLRNQYLATRDGQRFLLVEAANTSPTHLNLVRNFPALLDTKR